MNLIASVTCSRLEVCRCEYGSQVRGPARQLVSLGGVCASVWVMSRDVDLRGRQCGEQYSCSFRAAIGRPCSGLLCSDEGRFCAAALGLPALLSVALVWVDLSPAVRGPWSRSRVTWSEGRGGSERVRAANACALPRSRGGRVQKGARPLHRGRPRWCRASDPELRGCRLLRPKWLAVLLAQLCSLLHAGGDSTVAILAQAIWAH